MNRDPGSGSVPILQVDAFTAVPFAGNPAAVCLLPGPGQASWMQSVAREMNLSETAFLEVQADGYNLRWFTPAVEVDLCGHATLASAHVLFELGYVPPEGEARFHTRSGLLTATQSEGWIALNFPAEPAVPVATPAELARALGVEPVFVGRSRIDYLVEVASEGVVRALRPDFALLAQLPRGVIVTSRADVSVEYDFVSRFFAPAVGVNEDPVTGSAHCTLGPYWGARLGKGRLSAYQASARGGVVRVGLKGERVTLGGQAVTVLRGELRTRPELLARET
jgi:PhzF family phenazine biosynthesis protein